MLISVVKSGFLLTGVSLKAGNQWRCAAFGEDTICKQVMLNLRNMVTHIAGFHGNFCETLLYGNLLLHERHLAACVDLGSIFIVKTKSKVQHNSQFRAWSG